MPLLLLPSQLRICSVIAFNASEIASLYVDAQHVANAGARPYRDCQINTSLEQR